MRWLMGVNGTLFVLCFFLLLICYVYSESTIISYGMRRLALSLNQFGLDLFRAIEQTKQTDANYAFCPFCLGSSLAMLMAGIEPSQEQILENDSGSQSLYDSLRYALYLNSMQQQEINLAFMDLMQHLQVNLPKREFYPVWNESQLDPLTIIVNQVYVQRYLPLDYRYYRLMQLYYQTPIRTLHFSYGAQYQQSCHHINAMVKFQTDGKITNLIEPTENSTEKLSKGRLLFLSGLYFDGRLDLRQSNSASQTLKHKRALLQPIWPIRSPFLATTQHFINTQHQPPINRPYLPFKPWLMNQTIIDSTFTTSTTTTTSTIRPTPTATKAQASTNGQWTNETRILFNPFKPFEPTSSEDEKWSSPRSRQGRAIRLRYELNAYLMNATVVEMPLFGRSMLSMLVIVPDVQVSLSTMLTRINAQLIIDLLQSLQVQRFDITIPLINLTFSFNHMEEIFNEIGLSAMFEHNQHLPFGHWWSSILRTAPLPDAMQIYHKTLLKLDVLLDEFKPSEPSRENKKMSPLQQKRKQINLDNQTFIYFIIDNISGLVLTMGKYEPI